jgi:hypothetical protein
MYWFIQNEIKGTAYELPSGHIKGSLGWEIMQSLGIN